VLSVEFCGVEKCTYDSAQHSDKQHRKYEQVSAASLRHPTGRQQDGANISTASSPPKQKHGLLEAHPSSLQMYYPTEALPMIGRFRALMGVNLERKK
jgi:hypothetical protein